MADARRVADAAAASDRQVFVDMFDRFSPAHRILFEAAHSGTYGRLLELELELRTPLLWPGYDLGLDSIALDVMHGDLDVMHGDLDVLTRVLEHRFGDGQDLDSAVIEYTSSGTRTLKAEGPQNYAAMIDHVLTCLRGETENEISPSSVLDTLALTLDIHHAIQQRTA